MKQSNTSGRIAAVDFTDWHENVFALLDHFALERILAKQKRILLKPNLVEDKPPPVTTPVELVAAIIDYLQERVPDVPIVIGEGCGSLGYDTWHVFTALGYTDLAAAKGVELLDLNEAELVKKQDPACNRFPEIYLPKIVFDSFLLSVPMLKAHTLAQVTLTMKNMMGLAPPVHYQKGGHWKKASFHNGVQEAVFDLNRYRCADFTLLDATVGMSKAHLWGPTCEPPPNLLLAGFDPVSIDAHGAAILGRNWRQIGHIKMADSILGQADNIQLDTL